MAPHPILMHILHDDRNRDVEAILSSPLGDQRDETPTPGLVSCNHLAIRILAFIFGAHPAPSTGPTTNS